MKVRNLIKLLVVAALIVVVAFVAINGLKLGDSKYRVKSVGDAISLGLDLQGGISTVYTAKDPTVENFDALMDATWHPCVPA